jgi:hypothetical protein
MLDKKETTIAAIRHVQPSNDGVPMESRLILALMFAALAACSNDRSGASPAAAGSPLGFTRISVDPGNAGDCKAIADIDGDGRPDLIVGGSMLVWYQNPDWQKFVVATAAKEFTTDCQARDVNGDGRPDIVTGDGEGSNNVVWMENIDGGTRWARHSIGTHGNWVHDLEVADFDGDGRPDVLTHGNGTHLWYQDSPESWVDLNLSAGEKTKEGIGVGDIDGDRRIDFVQGGWWYSNPGSRAGPWRAHQFASGYDGGSYTAAVGDLNGDGRPDIVVSEQHKRQALAWYSAPPDPRTNNWAKNLLATDIGAHKLNIADMNGDGRADLVVGLELAELRLYVNRGGVTPRFGKNTLNTSGCHNARVADVNSDGHPDILCANYLGHPPVDLWQNQPPPAALDKWQYIKADSSRTKMGTGFPAFGLAFGDFNHDGWVDIVSGKYFYRNPGGDMTGQWSRLTFPVDADAMLVLDVDGDGQLDVLAQSLPDVYWLKPNADGSHWTAHLVARLPATGHKNGQGYRLARIVPGSTRPEVVFTTGDGVWYLRVPDGPAGSRWSSTKVASDTSDDVLAVGDLNGDGWDDIVASDGANGQTVYWFQNPGSASGAWRGSTIGSVSDWADRAEVADIDGDGRLDVVVSAENGKASGAMTYWFQAPADPKEQPWTRRTIATQGSTNSMGVADMDRNGTVEIVTGEHKGQLRVRIWRSTDGGRSWADTVIATGKESHIGTRLVDLNGDGALDIVSIAYDAFTDLHVWRNDSPAGHHR